MLRKQLLIGAVALLILAACTAPQATTPATESAMESHADTMVEGEMKEGDDAMAEGEMQEGNDAMVEGEMMEGDGAMAEGEMKEGDGAVAEGEMKEGDGAMAEGEMKEGDGAMAEGEMKEGDAMMNMADLPAWAALPLVDARTGESFTIADYAGQTIFVEPMATWCTNCRAQLNNVKEAKAQVTGDVVFVALSVETALNQAALAQYADENGFDWIFAVATPELLQQLAGDFGQTIANPPATPHFVISPDGTVSDLTTGIESVEAIVASVQG